MAGLIKRLIDSIIEQRAKGNPVIVETTKAKLILKGVNPEKFNCASTDDPGVEARVRAIAAQLGVVL